ncbi:MAG TPA: polymer-forming cytoskeletal protein [Vicinamibacterales bacterium]|jgi:cytoskeletal protein CcmA (bactofilin family)|nr:polymer-forming cytoskeletal protein [Vicinamibacterales bacterium]
MWSQEDPRHDKIKSVQPTEPQAQANRKSVEGNETRMAQFGRSVSVKGEIKASEDLTIDGQVDGRVDLPDHVLTVGPNATICADVTAKGVMVFGTVLGTIKAHDRVEIRKSGSVEGNVTCTRLVVQDGAILSGKVETKGARRPSQSRTAATEGTAQVLAPVA